MSGEADHVAFGIESIYPGVQFPENIMRNPVFAYCIEDFKEISVFLPVDLLEFDCDVVQFLESL